MRTKAEAISRLEEERHQVAPGQKFTVRRMRPEDAWAVARCFFAVYGAHYPFDCYYVPDQLIEANRSKAVLSAVACTPAGDVVGYAALFLSSAHSRRVYEYGQATVLPEYRSTFAAFCLQSFIVEELAPSEEIDALFGEAVCHHLITQTLAEAHGFGETALELGLMPASAYHDAEFPGERVSAVVYFRIERDRPGPIHLPAPYRTVLETSLAALGLAREIVPCQDEAPAGAATEIAPQHFAEAGVARFNIARLGPDLAGSLAGMDDQARRWGAPVTHAFVNLGEPLCGRAVDLLRERGYFLGGLVPCWFETDGLLLQRLDRLPPLASVRLKTDRARRILESVREDVRSNPACRPMRDASPGPF